MSFQKKLQIKINRDNATDNILKYNISIIWSLIQCQILLFFRCASVLQYRGIISRAFSLSILKSFEIKKKIRTVSAQKRNIRKDICNCLLQLTSNFLIQPILNTVCLFVYVPMGFWILAIAIRSKLTSVYPFIYVHIGFWIFTIAIRSNWSCYHNITNVRTTLHLSQIKQISDSYYVLHLFTNSTS